MSLRVTERLCLSQASWAVKGLFLAPAKQPARTRAHAPHKKDCNEAVTCSLEKNRPRSVTFKSNWTRLFFLYATCHRFSACSVLLLSCVARVRACVQPAWLELKRDLLLPSLPGTNGGVQLPLIKIKGRDMTILYVWDLSSICLLTL